MTLVLPFPPSFSVIPGGTEGWHQVPPAHSQLFLHPAYTTEVAQGWVWEHHVALLCWTLHLCLYQSPHATTHNRIALGTLVVAAECCLLVTFPAAVAESPSLRAAWGTSQSHSSFQYQTCLHGNSDGSRSSASVTSLTK